MNFSYLKYAIEVEKSGSITKAAQNLYMNQPHLSKIIRELERDFGCPIFERTSRGMIPSKKGEEFLRYAKSILVQMEQIEALCAENDSSRQELRVSVPRATYISSAFTDFIQSLPGGAPLNVHYRETNAMDTIRAVSEKNCDLGIIRTQSLTEFYEEKRLADENLHSEELWSFPCLVLMSQAHPLAHTPDLNYLMLRDYTEILHGDFSPPSFTFDSGEGNGSGAVRRTISIYERASQFQLLSCCPDTFMWTSPIPFQVLAATDLVQRPCSIPGNRYKDLLIYRNGYRLSREDTLFIQAVRRMVSRLSEG
ncbi:MAG: LysR family transcriptional regulator [Lachnospiraceae bacterium]|nr:LysR family transcriptional regulator [Lachnospiraceae bacterium]